MKSLHVFANFKCFSTKTVSEGCVGVAVKACLKGGDDAGTSVVVLSLLFQKGDGEQSYFIVV